MNTDQLPAQQQKNTQLHISLDMRVLIVILLVIIVGMLALWRPWSPSHATTDRTVQVSGEAKITAEPDEYIFYPRYEIKAADSKTGLAALSKKSDEIVAKLKSLGISDSKIKTSSSDYNNYYSVQDGATSTYTLSLTVTVNDHDLTQKVQDYLVTTEPTGAISPQSGFSDTKRKDLESKARDQATKDARSKADQSAKNLGFKVGSVKTVDDGNGFGGPIAYGTALATSSGTASDTTSTKLTVQPGENDLQYSVTVTYYIH